MPLVHVDDRGNVAPNAGGQEAFAHDWLHRYLALEGGWGSGKTWIGARKLLTLHLFNAQDAVGWPTGVPSVIVAPTYQNAADYDLPALYEACDEANLRVEYHRTKNVVELPDLSAGRHRKSLIWIRSAERPDRITGWQVGAVWGDEPTRWKEDRHDPKNDPLIQLMGRLRHPRARFLQMMLTYTNEGDTTRVYEEMHGDRPGRKLYRAATRENPLMVEWAERQRENLPPELAKQYLDGDAINLRGERLYGTFTREQNVNDALTLRDDLPIHMGLDFNIDPGMHVEVGQHDVDADRFTVVHEIFASRLDLRRSISKFEQLIGSLGGWRWPELQVYGDATGSSEWSGTGESCYEIVRQGLDRLEVPYRIRVPKANPPVIDRVNAMTVAMLDLRGQVHYQVHPRCERLIADLEQMKYDADGKVDKHDQQRSHASDAEGYRVSYLRPARVSRRRVGGRFSV